MKKIHSILFGLIVLIIISCGKDGESANEPGTNPDPDPILPAPPASNQKDSIGEGWKIIQLSDTVLADIEFKDQDTGYVTGIYTFRTKDGGNTWEKLRDPSEGVHLFITPNGTVHILNFRSTYFYIYLKWEEPVFLSQLPVTAFYDRDFCFLDDKTGFITGSDALLTTTDGGKNWQRVNPSSGLGITTHEGSAICFTDSVTGWISYGTRIYRSNGNLNQWVRCSTPSYYSGRYNTIKSVSPTTFYASGMGGIITKSTDGGNNFSEIARLEPMKDSTNAYTDIHFIDEQNGFACFLNKIYQTNDGGKTWKTVVKLVDDSIIEIDFTDINHGWACTLKGKVLKLKK